MTLADILTFARSIAQTDSNGLTDANGIVFANEALFDFHRVLISKGVDASQIQEAYASIVGGVGTYLFPTNMFFLKVIEVNFTDQTPNNYIATEQVSVANLPHGTSYSWLRANQRITSPLVDIRGDWFEIFPTPTIGNTNGIGIFYFLGPTPFVATTDTVSYPDSLDYRCMGWRIAANYKRSLLDFTSASAFEQEYQKHLTQITTTLEKGVQTPTQASTIRDAGWKY